MPPERRTLERRKDYGYFEAQDPEDRSQTIDVCVSPRRQAAVARRGMGAVRELSETVREILAKPERIFCGIRKDDDDDSGDCDGWVAYCGRPSRAFVGGVNSPGAQCREREPYDDEVFLVFVNDEGVAYNWRWEKCDPDDPTRPEGHAVRFDKELFP